jgi:arylsulfatase
VEVPPGGGEGMLATTGGRFGGWGFYLLKGKPVFVYNLLDLARERVEGGQALSPGKHTVVFDFKYDGPGVGKGGTSVIKVDDAEVARQQFSRTIPFAIEPSETFDIGSDTGTGVEDKDYQPPFPFTGKLNKFSVKLGPSGLSPAEQQAVKDSAIKQD